MRMKRQITTFNKGLTCFGDSQSCLVAGRRLPTLSMLLEDQKSKIESFVSNKTAVLFAVDDSTFTSLLIAADVLWLRTRAARLTFTFLQVED